MCIYIYICTCIHRKKQQQTRMRPFFRYSKFHAYAIIRRKVQTDGARVAIIYTKGANT